MEDTLEAFLRWFLNAGRLEEAATLLWPPSLFDARPRSVARIWKAIRDQRRFIILPGASSMGKTYTPGVKFFLEWIRDPEYTQVLVVGPSEEHLQSNLFSHLVRMHREAAIRVPGTVQELFIGLDPRNRRSAISGVVMPRGRQKGAGKLQGRKRYQRKNPHPVFGKMSRLFILVDELENVPEGIYPDLSNLASAIVDDADDGIRVVASYNPKDDTLTPYQLTDPPWGWRKTDPDVHFEWISKVGNYVVRLDAKHSENVESGTVIFPGLMSAAGYAETERRGGGPSGDGYYTFCRGMYPPKGSPTSIVPPALLANAHGDPVFIERPVAFAGVDVALEGGDHAKFAHGLLGEAREVRRPDGTLFTLRDAGGRPAIRKVAQLVGIIQLEKADTVAQAAAVRRYAIALNVPPELLTVDRTGNGSGVHDTLKNTYSPAVRGVNYSEHATDTRISEHDSETGHERFGDIATEMYSALRFGLEYGYFFVSNALPLDGSELAHQIGTRQTKPGGGKLTVESKNDFKKRQNKSTGNSPDDADAVVQGFHGIRLQTGIVFTPTAADGTAVRTGGGNPRDSKAAPTVDYANDNSADDLDTGGDFSDGIPAGFDP